MKKQVLLNFKSKNGHELLHYLQINDGFTRLTCFL